MIHYSRKEEEPQREQKKKKKRKEKGRKQDGWKEREGKPASQSSFLSVIHFGGTLLHFLSEISKSLIFYLDLTKKRKRKFGF